MTKLAIIGSVAIAMLATVVIAGRVPITWVSSGDYNSHVTRYRPECEQVLKRYMPNERKQHMTYAQYTAMLSALHGCNAHATPGASKEWVFMPITQPKVIR